MSKNKVSMIKHQIVFPQLRGAVVLSHCIGPSKLSGAVVLSITEGPVEAQRGSGSYPLRIISGHQITLQSMGSSFLRLTPFQFCIYLPSLFPNFTLNFHK